MKKIIDGYSYILYSKPIFSDEEMVKRSKTFYEWMDSRKSVRTFSDKKVPRIVIENIIKSASTAPSGVHKQPWTFCIIENSELKKQIRIAAEKEEFESYTSRVSSGWIDDLKPIRPDWHKPFLETAPFLIIVFRQIFEFGSDGEQKNNYYVQESVDIAAGILLTAIHNAGLVGLTHTPSPMGFLSKILNRSENEKPYLLIPVGYPSEVCWVPDISRKDLNEFAFFY